ncbi:MAG: hypothetical protein IJI14_16980 [Anaerolineaceae bacterium]|nr:hypothetical protein [Anaerolineaceae bacterium]
MHNKITLGTVTLPPGKSTPGTVSLLPQSGTGGLSPACAPNDFQLSAVPASGAQAPDTGVPESGHLYQVPRVPFGQKTGKN